MSTYLLTWNPKRSPDEELEEWAKMIKKGHEIEETRWSSGNNKHICIEDRVFLLRQGHSSPGIIGSGWVVKGSFKAPSWDAEKRKRGIKAWYVMVDWEDLVSPEEGLSRHALLQGILPASLINIASSGVTINPDLAEHLEKRWAAHLKRPLKLSRQILGQVSGREGEPIEYRGYRLKRDQKLRHHALDNSVGICSVCDVDYSQILEGKGVRVLQVHHKKQMSQQDAPRLNTIKDLAVVCANCHALIHMNAKKALSITELKTRLRRSSKSSA